MIKNYFSIACCLMAFTAYAQDHIKATVQYSDQTAAVYVDVLLLGADETVITSTTTDENGVFNLVAENGQYMLVIEEYGKQIYSQKISIQQSQDLGLILLAQAEEVTLKEAVVTGQKKLIEKKVDRLVFNVDQAEGAKGGDALDALKLAPRVKVENDIVSIVGKSALSVMIDDRIVDLKGEELSNYLKSIKADEIEKIEIITNPPAKYVASGNSGLLNIVLKQGKKDSWNGSLGTSTSYRSKWAVNTNGTFNYRKNKWTLTSNLSVGLNEWENTGVLDIYYPDSRWRDKPTYLGKNTYVSGRIGVDYQVNEKLSTGFKANINSYDNINNNRTTTLIEGYPSFNLLSYFNDFLHLNEETSYTTFNYHVIYKPDGKDKKLTFDFDWVRFNVDQESNTHTRFYTNENQEEKDRFNANKQIKDQNAQNYIFNLDMEHPTAFVKLNYGGRFSITSNKNTNEHYNSTSGTPIFDDKRSNQFNYDENIAAVYVSAEKELNDKWSAKLGLRYENTSSKGISPNNQTTDKYHYDGLFPTAYLSYEMTESHTFSINVGRRIDRPYMGYLNPYRIYSSPYSYSEGNKDIKPSYSYNYELEHAYKDVVVSSLYVNDTRGEIEQVIITNPETKIQVWTPQNVANTLSVGLSETVNFKPWRWWKVNANIDVFYAINEGKIPEMNYKTEGWNLSTRITNSFDLNTAKTIVANYSLYYSPKGTSGMDLSTSSVSSSVGLRASFLEKKLQLSFNIYNLFKDRQPSYTSYSNDIKNVYYNQSLRTFRVGLTYNFGKSFAIESSKSTSEQDRLK